DACSIYITTIGAYLTKYLHQSCYFWNTLYAMKYVNIYLAMCERNWNLRNAAIKATCPLFTAFDTHNYARLLPQHISHLLTLPNDVARQYESGAFAVSLKGVYYASVNGII
ncbi:unnamed protein product, partial [Owenia fusiformis]